MKLYGYKALKENLENVESVILTNNKNEAIELLKKNKIPYTIKPVSYFNTNFKNINHQFIVSTAKSKTSLNFDDYINSLSKKDKAIVVILDSILDPHNFGAILRTCEAFNVDAVIYKKDNQAQITDTVSKISQGAVNRLNMFKTTNLINSIETLKKNKFWIYASALNDNAINYGTVDYDAFTALIIGNEENGISKSILQASDFVVKIPMFGTSQSLNVSVATGILLAKIILK